MHFQQNIKYLPDNYKSFLLMIGKTDMAKAYYPYGISLCLTENGDDYAFWFESTGKVLKIFN